MPSNLRVAVVGGLVPPFTGSGVMKAILHGVDLARQLGQHDSIDQALAVWDARQAKLGTALFALAEHMEPRLILQPPDFARLDASQALEWWHTSTTPPVAG